MLEQSLAICRKKSYLLLEIHVMARLGKIYLKTFYLESFTLIQLNFYELGVLSLSVEFLELAITNLASYCDKNLEAQTYIYLAEAFSAEGFNMKAYPHFCILFLFRSLTIRTYELLRGAQTIAMETVNPIHLALCQERIPKEYKRKEKNKRRTLSERYRE